MTNETENYVDISGINKAELLAALFNASQPIGMGLLQAHMKGNHDMTVEEADLLIRRDILADNDAGFNVRADADGRVYSFDYIRGRPMKIDLSGDQAYIAAYDRDNGGPGTFAQIVETLRST